jgi:hypothetical protein
LFELSIFLRDHLVGRQVFNMDEVRIGRSEDNEVQIDNLALSRYHASIEHVAGVHVIKDFGSQNGTFVGGERVVGRRALNDGDRIGIGKYTIVFRAEKQAAASAEVRDEAAYAVAGKTLVARAIPAEVRERPCPYAAFLEGPPRGKDPPVVYPLVEDFFVIGSQAGCQLVDPGSPPRAAVIVRAWNGFSLLALAQGAVQRNRAATDLLAELRNDDELSFGGENRYRYRVGRPEAAP